MKDTARALLHLDPGVLIRARSLRSIEDDIVAIPDPGGMLVHLQFRRYAGCPICSLHLRSYARRYEDIARAGIREVVVFHSSRAELRKVHHQPFAVIADPDKRLYDEFGVGTSAAAVLDPRVWPTAVRAVALRASADPSAGIRDGSFGLPGDFLIGSDGRLLASKYGAHADDQWSVEELLALAWSVAATPLERRAIG